MHRKFGITQAVEVLRRCSPSVWKGWHTMYALVDSSGHEVARFGLTGHARDLSWGVLRKLEDGLTPWLGQKWTEQR